MLAKLQERYEAVQKEVAEHEIRMAREQLAAQKDPAMALTYGDFVKWAIEHARELEKQLITAAKAVDIAREQLTVLFEEQKRYEIAEANRLEEEKREEQRQETILLDEVGSVGFVRKKEER